MSFGHDAARSERNTIIAVKIARRLQPANTQIIAKYNGDSANCAMAGFLLLFDLDGTLIDSVPDLTNALNEILGERGYAPLVQEEVKPMVGDGVPALVARAFAARGGSPEEAAELLPCYIAFYEANATRFTRPYPGVRETLLELRRRGYRTAICTNKLQRATVRVLRGLELDDLFDGVAGGDRYAVRKPDPGHLLELIRELGGESRRAAMIGDSENDAAAGHAAALPVVLMRYGYARVDPESLAPDAVVDRFDELPQALEKLGLTP
jgi:phosphoglycolate phosphatase